MHNRDDAQDMEVDCHRPVWKPRLRPTAGVASFPVEAHARQLSTQGAPPNGDERAELWDRWREIDSNLDAYASRRPTETAVIVLEPLPGTSE